MRQLDAFWRSLDQIVEYAASDYDWRKALGDDWTFAERFLRARGDIVFSVGCPSPGGDGCPRQVVRMGPDTFRAACGNAPRECGPLDLTLNDVGILALDRHRLATEIAIALEIDLDYRERRGIIHLGRHLVTAGTGFPVDLVLGAATWRPPLHLHDFDDTAGVILLSSPSSLEMDLQSQLRARGHRLHLLGEVVGEDAGRIVATVTPTMLFRDLRDRIAGSTNPVPRPQWTLPPGTTWEKLKFDLISSEVINVSTAGQTRKLWPEHIGLRNQKTGKVTEGWVLLRTIIAMDGSFSFSNMEPRYEKQLQLLNKALREGLGIAASPIMKLGQGQYASQFIPPCSLSPAERAEISPRPRAPATKKSGQRFRQDRWPAGDE